MNFRQILSEDEKIMSRALDLAKIPEGCLLPNPRVGAVLARNGEIHFEGYHRGPGHPHAEADVFQKALKNGVRDFSHYQLFVTLEPCCHLEKRTPPCAPLILKHRPKEVVIAHLDPNPLVLGQGFKLLQSSKIRTKVGVLQEKCEALNQDFTKNQQLKLPYLTLKLAVTFDGKMADDFGKSQWITNSSSRADAQNYRGEATHVGVGARTFDHDNPTLNWRPSATRKIPRGVVIFGSPKRGIKSSAAARANGPHSIVLADRDLPLRKALRLLYQEHGVYHLLVEGGPTLAYQLLKADLVDRLVIYFGGGILGGKGAFSLGASEGVKKLRHLLSFSAKEAILLDGDVKTLGYRHVYRTHSKPRRG